jgi:hypothetical protein
VGRLDPNGGAAAGAAEILPASMAGDFVGSTVVLVIKPVGIHDNEQIIGAAIQFPIDVCSGCMGPIPLCPLPKGTVAVSGTCVFWQDNPGTCCEGATGVVCGSGVPISM